MRSSSFSFGLNGSNEGGHSYRQQKKSTMQFKAEMGTRVATWTRAYSALRKQSLNRRFIQIHTQS